MPEVSRNFGSTSGDSRALGIVDSARICQSQLDQHSTFAVGIFELSKGMPRLNPTALHQPDYMFVIFPIGKFRVPNCRPWRQSRMKILIVEDEAQTGEYLKQGLREAGYYTELTRDGVDGLHEATEGDYDLVLLDVNLPGIDGWSVLRSLRRKKPQLPVLYLTARDSVEDRVKGLELGADDYLIKPFSFSELLARIKTILRRGSQTQEATMLEVADLQLDLVRRRASRAGRRLDLTAKEFGLLELFMRRRGEVLPRTLIASLMWDINFDSESNVIVVAVGRLRSKIDDAFDVKLLRTVRGMGYVLDEPEP